MNKPNRSTEAGQESDNTSSQTEESTFAEEFALLLIGKHAGSTSEEVASSLAHALIGAEYVSLDPSPRQFAHGAVSAIADDLDTLANLLDLAGVAIKSMGGGQGVASLLDIASLQNTVKGMAHRLHGVANVVGEIVGGEP